MSAPEHVEANLKPMLAECIREAVKLALIDSAVPVELEADGQRRLWTDEEKAAFRRDIYAIPSSAIANMDPGALARNVANRLLGTGGWHLPDPRGGDPIYTGNATSREVFEASFERPDQDVIAEMGFDLGLRPAGDGMFEMPESDDGE